MKIVMNWIKKLLPVFNTTLEPVIDGILSKYYDAAKTALRSALTKIDSGADHLLAVYRKYESDHPLVQEAINEACKLLEIAGIDVPNADVVETHVKAAIHDLASVFVQPETGTVSSDATSSNTLSDSAPSSDETDSHGTDTL